MSVLTKEENEFLKWIYIQNMTIEQITEKTGMEALFIEKRKQKILKKLETVQTGAL